MTTKDKIKREIDRLGEDQLDKLYLYLHALKQEKKIRPKIRSMKLKGMLDNKHIRSEAYE